MTAVIGEEAERRIAPEAARTMRESIAATGGREVFFACGIDRSGRVVDARVCARGHEAAVPAVFETLNPRDVVIHNHPSGEIHPSEADLELSVVYTNNGHGVFIVNNDVSRVYVVVEPFLERDRRQISADESHAILGPDGVLSKRLSDYEARQQQMDMCSAATEAFNSDGIAVIEAPTGVGKTMAYLLPAVLWAVRNRERVVVSTRTINLQEQIIEKDIPLLQQCLDEPFHAVLVKGRQNYVCPRRLERALSEATLFDDEETQSAFKAIAEWMEHTEEGSRSDLPFLPPRDVWERVCSESDTCGTAQCLEAGNCFVMKARREIAKADIVVANHHMLFSDLAIKKEAGSFTSLAVLPSFQRLVLDEAHHVEDSATEYFGVEVTRFGTLALLGRVHRTERGQDRGLIPYIKIKLVSEAQSLSMSDIDRLLSFIDEKLAPAVSTAREAAESAFFALRAITAEKCGQIGRDVKWRLTDEVLQDSGLRRVHGEFMLPLAEALSRLAQHCDQLVLSLQDIAPTPDQPERPLGMETAQLQGFRDRLLRMANAVAESTSSELQPNTVRWVEIDSQKEGIVRAIRCPLSVAESLSEWVYPNLKTVVMTSATLSVGQRFDFLSHRIGLDKVQPERVQTLALSSPFDFSEQALLCVQADGPPPDSPKFLDACVSMIGESLAITKGRSFVLFTSFHALNYVHRALAPELRRMGIRALKQGEANRHQLLETFRNDTQSTLFGTDSFWEGVDVAGDSLQCVIVPRLPFRVPTEPILQARAEAIEAEGGKAFMDYTVPLAVIKFRQGFGRLIRRTSDKGSILVLDSRLMTKPYGKVFLESLPDARRVCGGRDEVLEAMRAFHDKLNREAS